MAADNLFLKLYILSFLHQTTTPYLFGQLHFSCISYHFYIKPQRSVLLQENGCSCISYHFYIKPQHVVEKYLFYKGL